MNLQTLIDRKVNRDNPTVEETAEQQRIVDERIITKLCEDYLKGEIQRKRQEKSRFDSQKFYELSRDVRLQVYNPKTQIGWKKKILKESGYTHLKSRKGEMIDLKDAKPSRIGNAFMNTYKTVERKYTKA